MQKCSITGRIQSTRRSALRHAVSYGGLLTPPGGVPNANRILDYEVSRDSWGEHLFAILLLGVAARRYRRM
jgi:hypothetical protein